MRRVVVGVSVIVEIFVVGGRIELPFAWMTGGLVNASHVAWSSASGGRFTFQVCGERGLARKDCLHPSTCARSCHVRASSRRMRCV